MFTRRFHPTVQRLVAMVDDLALTLPGNTVFERNCDCNYPLLAETILLHVEIMDW